MSVTLSASRRAERGSPRIRLRIVRFVLHHPGAIVGGILTILMLVLAMLGPTLAPADPDRIEVGMRLRPASGGHWLGTDQYGRDVLSRLFHGARYTVWISMASTAIALTVGIAAGIAAGYYGGWVDQIVSRIVDMLLALPSIFLALAIVAAFGPGLSKVILAMGIVGIPRVARIARGSALIVKQREMVEAARAVGASHWRIQFRHIVPNCVSPLVVFATLWAGTVVIYASGLSFLGVGVQPPTPEWGAMLADAQPYVLRAPLLAVYPGAAVTILALGLNMLGDGLRDYLDPGTRRQIQETSK